MSEQIMRENLFVLAQTFATAKGLSMTTVSKKIHGNQKFLEKYLAGEISTTIRIYFVMVNRLRSDWPPKTPWPITRATPKLTKVPYERQSHANSRKRGENGRFLRKKADKGSRAPAR